jgi:thioredoxin reductase (NADPH)
VTILIRSDAIENGMSHYLVDEIRRIPNITVRVNTQVLGLAGDQVLERICLLDSVSGQESEEPATVVFTFIGARPRTGWLADSVACDERGFVLTGAEVLRLAVPPTCWPLERAPLLLETSVPGTFAAGDVRAGSIKRVASGVGEGAMAVALMHQYRASH